MEGGGVRGIYTAGVLDVFLEQGISFDGVIGVSAGAIHGCSYLSGQHGRSIRYYCNYCADPRFMSIQSLIKTGDLVGVDFCYHELPEKLDPYDNEAFLRNAVPFYAVVSNVETGKPEYLRLMDMFRDIDILRASASMPFVSRIVEIGGKKYLDGGCTDSIPLKAFQQMGYGRNVVVLTRDAAYRKKPSNPLLAKTVYRRYPEFAQAQAERYRHYNETLDYIHQQERAGSVFVIRPHEPPVIGRTENDPEKVRRLYNMGREDALNQLDALKAWLSYQNKNEV